MTQYIEKAVQQTASNPTKEAEIELCIGCTTPNTDTIQNTITSLGGNIIDTFTTPATNGVIATVPETSVQTLIDHPETETIETNTLSLSAA